MIPASKVKIGDVLQAMPGAAFVTVTDGSYTVPASGRTLMLAGAATSTVVVSELLPGAVSASIRVRCVASTQAAQGTSEAVVLTACRADFTCDGGVDGDDTIRFFELWDSGASDGDVNLDGEIDGDDVIAFFFHWDAGC